jgi:hypothetical protein
MMKKVFSLIVVIMLLSAVSQATVIEDFEGFAVNDSLSGQTGWNVENGSYTVVADPLDASNKVMSLYQGASTAYLEIPTIPETDSSTTVSFRVMWEYDTIAHNGQVIGLADVMTNPVEWNNMGPIVRTAAGIIEYRDGAAYVNYLPKKTTDYGVWYDFELVLDNVNETYDIYINGTQEVTGAKYRNQGTVGDLVYMAFRSGSAPGDTGSMYIDDITIGFDFVPTPAHGSTVHPETATPLSWTTLPVCDNESDSATVDVYWNTNSDGSDKAAGTVHYDVLAAGALSTLVSESVADNTTYYWKIVATDPDTGSATPAPFEMESAIYSLTTASNLPPTVVVNDPGYQWLNVVGEKTVTITSTVYDEDDYGAHIYTWSATPATVVFIPNGTNTANVTSAKFTADGDYELTLTVFDDIDEHIVPSIPVAVHVYADACEATKGEGVDGNPLDPYNETAARERGDTDYNCDVNLADLAIMVSNWLSEVSK